MQLPKASDKELYKDMLFNHFFSLLGDEVAVHILKNKEDDFYDLDKFKRAYKISQVDLDVMTNLLEKMLKQNGFNTFLGFGGTGLFIYTTPEKPQGAF